MTVDLSKAKPGMIVTFRCGGTAKIIHHRCIRELGFKFRIGFEGFHSKVAGDGNAAGFVYTTKGICGSQYGDGPGLFDIVALEEPPFDWNDVRPGMAFKGGSSLLHFIGRSTQGEPVFEWSQYEGRYGQWSPHTDIHCLKRTPEKDIEVPS